MRIEAPEPDEIVCKPRVGISATLALIMMAILGMMLLSAGIWRMVQARTHGDWVIAVFGVGLVAMAVAAHFFQKGPTNQEIILYPNAKRVVFRSYIQRQGFLKSRRLPEVVVPFEEVLDCHYMPGRRGPGIIMVVTPNGSYQVSEDTTNFDELRRILAAAAATTPDGPLTHNPWIQTIIILVVGFGFAGAVIWLAIALNWV